MYQNYCPCYLHLYMACFLTNCLQNARNAASDNPFFQNFLGENTPRPLFGFAPEALDISRRRRSYAPPPPPPPPAIRLATGLGFLGTQLLCWKVNGKASTLEKSLLDPIAAENSTCFACPPWWMYSSKRSARELCVGAFLIVKRTTITRC